MRFNQRLLIAFVVPSVLFVGGLTAAIGSLINTQREFDGYLQTEAAIANGVREMYAQGLQMGQAMRNIVLDPGNPTAYKNLDGAREAYDKAFDESQRLAKGLTVEPAILALGELRATQGRAQQQVLDTLKHLTGHDIAVRVNPAFVRASEVHRLCGAPDKLIGCIGPLPVYPLTECLSAMIQAHATQARPAPL